jgi:hypothetical protein
MVKRRREPRITLAEPAPAGVFYKGKFYAMRDSTFRLFKALFRTTGKRDAGGKYLSTYQMQRASGLTASTVQIRLSGLRSIAPDLGLRLERATGSQRYRLVKITAPRRWAKGWEARNRSQRASQDAS